MWRSSRPTSAAVGRRGAPRGKVLPQWLKIAALEAMVGRDAALAFCQTSQSVVGEIERFCKENDIDADFRMAAWLWSATSERQLGSWNGVLGMLTERGLGMMRAVSRDEIQDMMDMPGLLGARASCRARRRCSRPSSSAGSGGWLCRAACKSMRTARCCGSSAARGRQSGLPTAILSADRVVLALNAWSLRIPALRPAILVIASDDQVSEPVPELLEALRYRGKPQITDSQTFVTGFRTTPDGRLSGGVTGGRLGIGSLDGTRFEGRSAREAEMHAFYSRANPRLSAVPFADSWFGPIDRTRSGLPLFGALPGWPDVFYGYGFSGNGIATSPLAGRILASLALGARDEWSEGPLVRSPERWLPPEPFRTAGSWAVRAAVRRSDGLGYAGKRAGPLTRYFAGMAPGGVSTT